ncbi:MAG: permease-like cell division protein FtsX [Bacteroidia bacterium]|nr:permease-like cell division protein FtsX [Bacteroidia bacterium]
MSEPIKRKKKFSYAFSIVSISMVLLMLGLFGFLVLASRHMETYVKENRVINVFLHTHASDSEVQIVRARIEPQPYVKSISYISKEQAANEFANELGQDFVSFLGFNPLMGSFQVKLKEDFSNNEEIAKIEAELSLIPGINEVKYQRNAYDLAQKNIRNIGLTFVFLASVFALIAVVLIHNTVRLNLYAQRFLIKSMQLVGATPWFITKPFIWQSVKNGLWGWGIALLLLTVLDQTVPVFIPEWGQFNHGNSLWVLYGVLFVLGMIMSIASSFISTRKYLNTRLEDLY